MKGKYVKVALLFVEEILELSYDLKLILSVQSFWS